MTAPSTLTPLGEMLNSVGSTLMSVVSTCTKIKHDSDAERESARQSTKAHSTGIRRRAACHVLVCDSAPRQLHMAHGKAMYNLAAYKESDRQASE